MLEQAQKQIESCRSLEALKDVWAENAERWKDLPKNEAAKIIRLKDHRKEEIETGFYQRWMDSKTLGVVDVVFDARNPDLAMVDGVVYSNAEMRDLIGRGLPADELRAVHETKKAFDGEAVSLVDVAGMEFKKTSSDDFGGRR